MQTAKQFAVRFTVLLVVGVLTLGLASSVLAGNQFTPLSAIRHSGLVAAVTPNTDVVGDVAATVAAATAVASLALQLQEYYEEEEAAVVTEYAELTVLVAAGGAANAGLYDTKLTAQQMSQIAQNTFDN